MQSITMNSGSINCEVDFFGCASVGVCYIGGDSKLISQLWEIINNEMLEQDEKLKLITILMREYLFKGRNNVK